MKKKFVAILVMSVLVLPTTMVRLLPAAPFPMSGPGCDPEGNFRYGTVKFILNHKHVWALIGGGFYPVPKTDVDLFDDFSGHTDGLGRVCFQIHVHIRDNTILYNGEVRLEATVTRLSPEPKAFKTKLYWKITQGKEEEDFFLDITADELDEGVTATYSVSVEARFAVYGLGGKKDAWSDSDSTVVTVKSMAHPAYQQVVDITQPDPGSTYTIGETDHVTGYLTTVDPPGGPVSDTRVCIVLTTERGFGSQTHYVWTDVGGFFYLEYCIADPLANGTLIISVYDDIKSDEYRADHDGDIVEIEAVHATETFGLFAVPQSPSVAPGYSMNYLVAVTSFNYVGFVGLDVLETSIPIGYEFDDWNPLDFTDWENETLGSWLTVTTSPETPLGLHTFNMTATDGIVTRELTCPLVVDSLVDLYIPHDDIDMQSFVGVINQNLSAQTVTVTLEYELAPEVWTIIGTKSTTVEGYNMTGIIFEDELEAEGLLGNPSLQLRASTVCPVSGIPVERSVLTHVTRPGDINSDDQVGLKDAVRLSTAYAVPPTYPYPSPEDINLDGEVGLSDAIMLSTRYGQTSP